ncbi:MFS transporter [Asticcacaulis machinosus]|uniref:MFS transporter n=1 Tax=Asticcacaulis machinosus TaxID=2984211 RepID=A0ABT5HEY7_9CAUL|nr:MFS transporter [Asticcacaulis machinosus]MDC7674742.1 MFS transporter [Asticcacaulis machinosus]
MAIPFLSLQPDRIHRFTVVSGVGLCQLIAFGTSLYLLTVLAVPIVRDTGWSLGWVVGGYSIGVLVSAAIAPLAGRYIGAGYGHYVLAASSLLFASGLATVSLSEHLIIYVAAWAVMGLGMGAGLYDSAFGAVGRIFGQSARSLIIQIALWGGFASTVFWPLSEYLQVNFGWRVACQVFAALHLIVCLPIYLWLLPRPKDATAPNDVSALAKITPEPNERAIYIALGFVITCEMAIVAMMSVHMHTILQSRGLSSTAAVALSALVGPSQVVSRLVELTIGRRWPPYLSMTLGVLGVAAALGLIIFGTGLNTPALIIYGAGLGVVSITTGTVPLAIFGPVRYPLLMGRLRRISLGMQAVTPAIGAWILTHIGMNMLLSFIGGLSLLCMVVCVYLAQLCRRHVVAMI